MPVNAMVIAMLFGLGVTYWRPLLGRRIVMAAAGVLLVVAVIPVGPAMVWGLERTYPIPDPAPKTVDGMIVLGGMFEERKHQETGQLNANEDVDRLFCFSALADLYPKAKLVFTGGAGALGFPEAKEALSAARYFSSLTLDQTRIIYESESRNTHENAVFSKRMIAPSANENWLLITSAYHMPRSVAVFEKQGWRVTPYPCGRQTHISSWSIFSDFNASWNLRMLNLAAREWVGLVVYRITGKSAFILTPASLRSGE